MREHFFNKNTENRIRDVDLYSDGLDQSWFVNGNQCEASKHKLAFEVSLRSEKKVDKQHINRAS